MISKQRVDQLQPWVSTVGRLILAGVWLVAGGTKVTDLQGSIRSVHAYRLFSSGVGQAIGAGLPFLEIALGLLLLVGLAVRFNAIASAALLAAFSAGIASAWARGLRIDCGCFGSGGVLPAGANPTYGSELLRDGLLIAIAGALAIWPITKLSADAWLLGAPAPSVPNDDLLEEETR